MKSKADWISGASYVAGGGLAAAAVGFATIAPHYQTQILAISAIAIGVAGLLVRLFNNQTPTQTATLPTTDGGSVVVKTVAAPTPQKVSP